MDSSRSFWQDAPGKIGPDLATQWTRSGDGTKLAFKLREGVKWHDGKPLRIKVSTRNTPTYRDQAVILIDHLKNVLIEGELEPLDASV